MAGDTLAQRAGRRVGWCGGDVSCFPAGKPRGGRDGRRTICHRRDRDGSGGASFAGGDAVGECDQLVFGASEELFAAHVVRDALGVQLSMCVADFDS